MTDPVPYFDPEVDQQILADTQDQSPNPADALVPCTDVDSFAKHMVAWHESRLAMLRHLLTVPEGASFLIGEEEKEFVLEGDLRAAFLLGVELSLMQVQELPFVAELEDAA